MDVSDFPYHLCTERTIKYFYREYNGFQFLYRSVCQECGNIWTCSLVPARGDLLQTGKMVGLWSSRPRPIPGMEERRVWRNLTALPWNYFDEGYDPEARSEVIERRIEASERREEQIESEEEFKRFRRAGIMARWP